MDTDYIKLHKNNYFYTIYNMLKLHLKEVAR